MRLIERWVEEAAAKQFRKPLRYIGVDEVSYGRGQNKYLTIVWDHARSRIVWIGRGKDRDALDAFFAKLGSVRAHQLVAVTMDMAQGYINAVAEAAPQADIVFDRFHIERYLTRAVDEVRKQEFWRRGGRYRATIRGKKWLLLKKHRRIHWRRRGDLAILLMQNARLFRAYVLKEHFEVHCPLAQVAQLDTTRSAHRVLGDADAASRRRHSVGEAPALERRTRGQQRTRPLRQPASAWLSQPEQPDARALSCVLEVARRAITRMREERFF